MTGGVMRTGKWKLWLVALFLFPSVCWADNLEIALGVPKGLDFMVPFDKTMRVRTQPMPFSVILTNRSSSSVSIYWEPEAGATKSISFELKGEDGRIFIVKRKEAPLMSTAAVNTYLAAGGKITKTLKMAIDEWENLPVIEPGKVKQFQIRVLYNNDGKTIYSEYYTLRLDGR
jgi:hypothetical protein